MRTTEMTAPDAAPDTPPAATRDHVIRVHDVCKRYRMGVENVHALQGVSLTIAANDYVAVMGQSGSGKSTFMNIIGCLDRPTPGEYWLAGHRYRA